MSFPKVRIATFPARYPADGQSIAIEVKGSIQTDAADLFWKVEPENLRHQFATLVKSRIGSGEINHVSVFGLAPIPLLIQLGRLLGDITPADEYQLHREPAGWPGAKTGPRICYKTTMPTNKNGPVALRLGLSATITDDRITSVLGKDASTWSIHTVAPGNDIMRYPEDLSEFRRLLRQTYQAIKATHGTSEAKASFLVSKSGTNRHAQELAAPMCPRGRSRPSISGCKALDFTACPFHFR